MANELNSDIYAYQVMYGYALVKILKYEEFAIKMPIVASLICPLVNRLYPKWVFQRKYFSSCGRIGSSSFLPQSYSISSTTNTGMGCPRFLVPSGPRHQTSGF